MLWLRNYGFVVDRGNSAEFVKPLHCTTKNGLTILIYKRFRINQKNFPYDAICRSRLLQSIFRSGRNARVYLLKNGEKNEKIIRQIEYFGGNLVDCFVRRKHAKQKR